MLEQVKIGGIVYDIRRVADLRDEHDTKLDGWYQGSKCLISINADVTSQSAFQTLWHEIIRGIIAHAGMRDQHDESLIEAISHGVMQVLRDNPGIEQLPE